MTDKKANTKTNNNRKFQLKKVTPEKKYKKNTIK
jgi:hypothetical protein